MKIGIAVFSGTGNTAHVTELLALELQQLGAMVEIHVIDSHNFHDGVPASGAFNPSNYDLSGISHPVLGFGPPPLVLRFAETIQKGQGRMFVFKSAADNHPINNSASEDLIRVLEQKGYTVFHDFLYIMPCNWIFSYARRFNLQIIDRAKLKAAHHARELMQGARSLAPVHRCWRRIGRFFHHLETTYGRKQFSQALHASANCTHCGQCIRNCPAGNISEAKQKILFGLNCLWCMRCVYSCPSRAISARGMNWCIIKNGYRLRDLVEAEDQNRVFITANSRGYWKHFVEYFKY